MVAGTMPDHDCGTSMDPWSQQRRLVGVWESSPDHLSLAIAAWFQKQGYPDSDGSLPLTSCVVLHEPAPVCTPQFPHQ